jgi:hypothetical protein
MTAEADASRWRGSKGSATSGPAFAGDAATLHPALLPDEGPACP